jgi:hypothetical protein
MTKQAELEAVAEKVIRSHGLRDFHATGVLHAGEPLTLTDGERTIGVEIRVTDLTGWQDER